MSHEGVRSKLNELKAYGLLLPEDLAEFEHDLADEFRARNEAERGRFRMDKVIAQRARR